MLPLDDLSTNRIVNRYGVNHHVRTHINAVNKGGFYGSEHVKDQPINYFTCWNIYSDQGYYPQGFRSWKSVEFSDLV